MKAKLRNLLAGSGILLTVSGIVTLATVPKPGTTRAELLDAGITQDCTFRRVACTIFDGGYREVEFTLATCPPGDGGEIESIWPPRAAALRSLMVGAEVNCRRLRAESDVDFNEDPPERAGSCACWRPDAGACTQADGGPPDPTNERQPGDWSGPGCIPITCGELAGRPHFPPQCPTRLP